MKAKKQLFDNNKAKKITFATKKAVLGIKKQFLNKN
jgi:hypothetical protein